MFERKQIETAERLQKHGVSAGFVHGIGLVEGDPAPQFQNIDDPEFTAKLDRAFAAVAVYKVGETTSNPETPATDSGLGEGDSIDPAGTGLL